MSCSRAQEESANSACPIQPQHRQQQQRPRWELRNGQGGRGELNPRRGGYIPDVSGVRTRVLDSQPSLLKQDRLRDNFDEKRSDGKAWNGIHCR